jgi:serine/threonine-protein kinase
VEVFDFGRTQDGTFYYVMEHLDGLSLDEIVRTQGPLPAGRVLHVLGQVCGALREAHAAGLIHRDIKPGNIFLCRHGGLHDVVKLLDFGLVQTPDEAATRLTQAGHILGTPAYMAPEQAAGDLPDARSDLYSLGATAFHLLTGRPPFPGRSPLEVLFAHRQEPVPPLEGPGLEVPADLAAVVRRCLAKHPADRYADADELDRALRRCDRVAPWTEEMARVWWQAVPPAG